MTEPIMSRFDIFFIALDRQDSELDFLIANNIVDTHMNALKINDNDDDECNDD